MALQLPEPGLERHGSLAVGRLFPAGGARHVVALRQLRVEPAGRAPGVERVLARVGCVVGHGL